MFRRITAPSLALAAGLLVGGCGKGFNSTIIADGGIVVNGSEVTLHGTGGSEATVDATGKLEVDGRGITVDAAQRQLLQQYYQGALAVRGHGLATGRAGASVAVQSLKHAATQVVGDDSDQADPGLDAATRRVSEEASKICLDIQQIRLAQNGLAATLPAFKPFAEIIDGSDSDCSKDS